MSSSCRVKPIVALLGAVALSLAAPGAYALNCAGTAGADLSTGTNLNCNVSTDSTLGAAIYSNPTNSTVVGSGVINPFLTVQKNGTESGFSTDIASVNDLPLDDKRNNANTFTNTFAISQLGFAGADGNAWVSGTQYFQFFLDVNEPANEADRLISLDYLKIYDTNSSTPVLLGKPTSLADLDAIAGWTLVYDLDGGGANDVLLNYIFFAGSGKDFDLSVLIPVTEFDLSDTDDRLVFATAFGDAGGSASTADGYEEWWYRTGTTNNEVCPPPLTGVPPFCVLPPVTIPEPGSLALLGFGLAGLAIIRRRRTV